MRTRLCVSALAAIALVLCSSGRLSKALLVPPAPVHSVATSEKVVALTFDDGPRPIYTPAILRALRRANVKATFFMIGERMEYYPDIVRQAAADGHVIANHTYSHPTDLAKVNHGAILREIAECDRVIQRQTGQQNHLFRPPKGFLGRQLPWLVRDEGYTMVLWSVSAYQYKGRTPEQMAHRVISLARPGAIILMHDGRYRMRWRDVEATPLIIDGLRKRGYRFVTVPELLRLAETP